MTEFDNPGQIDAEFNNLDAEFLQPHAVFSNVDAEFDTLW